MKVEEMTEEEINRAIYTFMGWRWKGSDVVPERSPTNSLDTIALVEQEIEKRGLHKKYIQELDWLVNHDLENWVTETWSVATAPPRTRAETLVRVIRETNEEES